MHTQLIVFNKMWHEIITKHLSARQLILLRISFCMYIFMSHANFLHVARRALEVWRAHAATPLSAGHAQC